MTIDDDTVIGTWDKVYRKSFGGAPIHLSDLDEPFRSATILGFNQGLRIAELEARLAKAEAALEAADETYCFRCDRQLGGPIKEPHCDCSDYRHSREAMK